MHVLYVEDDRLNALLFEAGAHAAAASVGIEVEVRVAADGAEARQSLAERGPPDLLVIDLHLPDARGSDLLRGLRESQPRLAAVPAWLCSADDPADLAGEAAAAGFAGCWAKPVSPQALAHVLAALAAARGAGDPFEDTAR